LATLSRSSLVVASLLLISTGTARADTRGVLRIGLTPVDLAATDDTPLIGAPVDDAIEAYNAAADAYNDAHGFDDGSPMAEASIDRGDLGVRADLVTFSPALEVGGRYYFFRLEGAIGAGDGLRAFGVGVYPVNLAAPLRRGAIVPYLSAGGAASWLDRNDVDGELGGLLTARAAIGVRVQRRVTVEVGYGAFVLGGLVDRGQIKDRSDYDPRDDAPPPSPETAIAGGEQRGLVDVSIGLALD
jgi:hypothetical protein